MPKAQAAENVERTPISDIQPNDGVEGASSSSKTERENHDEQAREEERSSLRTAATFNISN